MNGREAARPPARFRGFLRRDHLALRCWMVDQVGYRNNLLAWWAALRRYDLGLSLSLHPLPSASGIHGDTITPDRPRIERQPRVRRDAGEGRVLSLVSSVRGHLRT
jgi:hypothetical protein